MTYLSFLVLFLALPLGAAVAVAGRAARRGPGITRLEAGTLLAHVALAVAYTTPWDNFLVATGVWTYSPARVLGITLGWVPLEEYAFFVLQTLLTGLIALLVARRLPAARRDQPPRRLNVTVALLLAGVWACAVLLLASGWKPGAYLGLELAWALPPLALLLVVGADELWRRRRAVLLSLLLVTLYLCAADLLAIRAGVWRINPAQSLNLFLGGLPVEEAIFFLLTNALVVFGVTLALAPETRARWLRWRTTGARPAITARGPIVTATDNRGRPSS